MAVLDDELHGVVFGVHVGHFAFQAVVPHYGGRKDDCEVLWCHLEDISTNRVDEVMLRRDKPNSRFLGLPHVQDGRLRIQDSRDASVVAY